MSKNDEIRDDIADRGMVIAELLELDGVPLDALSATALVSLGVHYMVKDYGLERTAVILDGWAFNVRHDIRAGKKA